jgi:TRAP-type mannitol/chloroaromatic compound transport system permease small subunit
MNDKRYRQIVHLLLFVFHLIGLVALGNFIFWGACALFFAISDAPFTGSIAYLDKRIFFLIPLCLLGLLNCVQRAWDRILDSFTF